MKETRSQSKRRLVLLSIVAVLMIIPSSTVSANLILSDTSFEVSLIGGDGVTENITIKNTYSSQISVFIDTNIIPDGDGFNVTYSTGPKFILNSSETKMVTMYINTSPLLMPEVYIITSTFNYETEVVEFTPLPTKSHRHAIGVIVDTTENNSFTPIDNNTIPPKNETPPPVGHNDLPESPNYFWFWFILMFICIIISVLLLVIVRKKHKEERK